MRHENSSGRLTGGDGPSWSNRLESVMEAQNVQHFHRVAKSRAYNERREKQWEQRIREELAGRGI